MPFDYKRCNNDPTIVCIASQGEKNWGQFHEMIDRFVEDLQNTEQRLDLVIDDSEGMPSGNPMPHIKTIAQKVVTFPHMGLIVVASARKTSFVLDTLVNTVHHVYEIDSRINGGFAQSLEEAVDIIEKDRAKEAAT